MVHEMLNLLLTLILGLFLLIVLIAWGVALWVILDESKALLRDIKEKDDANEDW